MPRVLPLIVLGILAFVLIFFISIAATFSQCRQHSGAVRKVGLTSLCRKVEQGRVLSRPLLLSIVPEGTTNQ